MRLITIARLQREFGLSYVTAAMIIDEQGRLARQHYRMLGVLYGCGMLTFVGLAFTDIHWPHDAQLLIPLAMLPLILLQHFLVARASRELILAAARARSARTAPAR